MAESSGIDQVLGEFLVSGGFGTPSKLERIPSEYRTSFPLERVELELESGGHLSIAFKRLDWDELDPNARLAKPRFLHDPGRELDVYRTVLPDLDGPPHHYGSVQEPDRHWLFVEWVEGRELYQVGDRGLWEQAAGWLARMHRQMADGCGAEHLITYDAVYYRRWIERAAEFTRSGGNGDPARVTWLSERYEQVIEALVSLPATFVHGEFYASNVIVSGNAASLRVAPVDWELAAIAPGVIDLAALVSGGWSERDRDAIVSAYRSAMGGDREIDRSLDFARLHLAVQWLGWAPPSWTPPESQRHDWLGEAVELAEKLGI